jgi:hypothetical protein
MSLLGQKTKNGSQTIDELYKTLKIEKYLAQVKIDAELAHPSTNFYGGCK